MSITTIELPASSSGKTAIAVGWGVGASTVGGSSVGGIAVAVGVSSTFAITAVGTALTGFGATVGMAVSTAIGVGVAVGIDGGITRGGGIGVGVAVATAAGLRVGVAVGAIPTVKLPTCLSIRTSYRPGPAETSNENGTVAALPTTIRWVDWT